MKFANEETFFKRTLAYKRFFSQFSMKTFLQKQEELRINEMRIKSLICDILGYVFQLREDFLLDNFFHFFTKEFIHKGNKSFKKEMKKLFPDAMLRIKEKRNISEDRFWGKDVFNLDEILEKAVVEVLMVAFFLAQDTVVQEKVMGLIVQATTLTQRFYGNLKKLELLTSSDEKRTYVKFNKYMDRLKVSNFTTQVCKRKIMEIFFFIFTQF